MSGGAYSYAYRKIDGFVEEMRKKMEEDPHEFNPAQIEARERFAEHLLKVASVMRDIEWVDSSDCSTPADTDSIEEFFRAKE